MLLPVLIIMCLPSRHQPVVTVLILPQTLPSPHPLTINYTCTPGTTLTKIITRSMYSTQVCPSRKMPVILSFKELKLLSKSVTRKNAGDPQLHRIEAPL